MKKTLFYFLLLFLATSKIFATGEPSTYFQIYLSPNNDAVKRDVCLIVTAIYDDTQFEIIDDGADGDTDDSKTGVLKAGQSYILYIKDNGINDDARYASGGVLKWDGDYFIIKSNKLVYASQSTNSDWQHDWVPSVDKSSIGQKFIVYAPMISSSNRDINVFAYQDNTEVQFHKISTQAKTNTGFTDVNSENPILIFSKNLNIGQDLIYSSTEGKNVMISGETYVVTSNKPITVQYGALFQNERDGGGYVPTSNGSSSGELIYFGVPYQSGGEQEIRIVSWDDANAIKLDRYSNGNWVAVKSFTLNKSKAGDWVGKTDGNVSYNTVFRISCSPGKKVSVFEGNWFETGSPGTSDMATMVSSDNGTSAGKNFLTYIPPPGNEANAVNPFTGTKFGGQFSHLYLFSKNGATVTIKDANSDGKKFNKTFTILPERYADCSISLAEWKTIYNGTGTNSGPDKPYLSVTSDADISVMNSNFNDNWMCYTGSSLGHSFSQTGSINDNTLIPAEKAKAVSVITTTSEVTEPLIEVLVQDGLKVVDSRIIDSNNQIILGDIQEFADKTKVVFNDLQTLTANTVYTVETTVIATVGANNGEILSQTINATIETIITGKVNNEIQQSTIANSISVNTRNTSKLIFSHFEDTVFNLNATNSWTLSWVDINSDGWDDLFVTDTDLTAPNSIFMNNKNGGFTAGQVLPEAGISMSNTWADTDNDGDPDLLVFNNTRTSNSFYRNDKGTLVLDNTKAFTKDVSYYHGGTFADYDNDNKVDLFMCNYFPTKYNELHKNNANGTFSKVTTEAIPLEANSSLGPTWADYDQDGFMDLFVPNGIGKNNSLFHNDGNGTFSKTNNVINAEGGKSVGSCWGDIDNDGDLDLFVTNSNNTTNFLYKNNGNGSFEKISNSIVNQGGSSHGCSFADIDNDGDLDLFVTNDKSRKYLYFNDGTGVFIEDKSEMIAFNFALSFGHSWSDYDHDGDLDLAVATHSNQKNHIFVNNGNVNNWVEFKLKATVSNGSSIGAKISTHTTDVTQFREVNSQSGFGGQSSYNQHFGLGATTAIDSIEVKWPSGIRQIVKNVAINSIVEITEPYQQKVTGLVYFDSNNDGQKQTEEPIITRAGIKIMPIDTKAYSDVNGLFSFFSTDNNCNLSILEENGLSASVTAKEIDLTTYNVSDVIEIAAIPVCSTSDLKLSMGGTAIRKGYSNGQFNIVATNQTRNIAQNFTVNFVAPSAITIQNPSIPYSQQQSFVENGISYNRYSWSISNLNAFENKTISFSHGNDASVQIGNTFVFKGAILSPDTDCTPLNNFVEQTYLVYGAIDPNDILVSPKGYGEEGYILSSQVLNYTIRFENVGNFPAEKVIIVDELPIELNINSLKVMASSHENVKTEIAGRAVKFTWEAINLPSSIENNSEGQGYISFSVQPIAELNSETKIVNSASILFDQDAALVTNKVVNTIQSKSAEIDLVVVRMYPNPVNDVVFVSLRHEKGNEFTTKLISKVSIITMQGLIVLENKFENETEIRMDLPLELHGFYFIKIIDSDGQSHVEKMIVKDRF